MVLKNGCSEYRIGFDEDILMRPLRRAKARYCAQAAFADEVGDLTRERAGVTTGVDAESVLNLISQCELPGRVVGEHFTDCISAACLTDQLGEQHRDVAT